MRLSVVVPCYNEEMVIESFDAKTRALLDSLPVDYEICYVDDGSSDRTLDLLRALAKKHPAGLRYTSFSRNFGKEAAMLAGLREATGDAVVIMDADLQHPPELIGRMLELHAVGHDQVIARRDRSGESRLRKALGKTYYRMVNRWVDVELVDGVGDFRLLSRRAVNALLSMPEQNRFSKGLFSWIGFDTITFAYTNVAREAGETKWRFGALVNYGVDGLISFNNRPLRVAIHLGLLLAGLATLYVAWTVVSTLAFGVRTPGYATLLAAIVGMGGAQMVMLGLVGEYIGRIYYETKRRPHFLVKETNAPGSDSAPPIRTRAGATEAGAVTSTGMPLSATWNRTVGQ
ncbi:glycosyltransferase family 2 protein [Streptomyces sp. CA-294286]|uniref:glycosyltransferase family 2 protein n=1 Tax=Streptomyces sp. CA-294286 TaxID=3240070 RepID=UPI003D90CCED